MTDVLEVRELHDRSRSAKGVLGPRLSNPQPGGRAAVAKPRLPARPKITLDGLHCKIFMILQTEGRISIADLAKRINQTERRCARRMKELEDARIITGYTAVVDLDRLQELHPPSREITVVFARARLRDNKLETAFLKYLCTVDEVVECFEIDGDDDYELHFSCVSRRRYNQLRKEISEKFSVMFHTQQAIPLLHKRAYSYRIGCSRP